MSCITEILKLKGDKEVLLSLDEDGKPWIAVEGGGKYKDYEYLIVLNHQGHRCGYIAIKPEHPANNIKPVFDPFLQKERFNYDALDIDCHGGLTFGGSNHGLKDLLSTSCTDNWIGFDCGHIGDLCDVEAFTKYFGEEERKKKQYFFDAMNYDFGIRSIKNFVYVETECKCIIDQLIEQAA